MGDVARETTERATDAKFGSRVDDDEGDDLRPPDVNSTSISTCTGLNLPSLAFLFLVEGFGDSARLPPRSGASESLVSGAADFL